MIHPDHGTAVAQFTPDWKPLRAILFDNVSLERKPRKRILKAFESFIEEGLQQNDQFMIALSLAFSRTLSMGAPTWAARALSNLRSLSVKSRRPVWPT